jgi:hypothetical protein
MDGRDQLALGVGLVVAQLDISLGGIGAELAHDVGESLVPIDLRLAKTEKIEVGPVDDQDPGH